jgi:hypothetical protein
MTVLTRDLIEAKMASNDVWLNNAIVCLFRRQTEDEKNANVTRHDNDRGFNRPDSPFLTSMAKIILWARNRGKADSEILTPRQRAKAVIRMRKYSGQLLRIANR